jgi:hypothetical protein
LQIKQILLNLQPKKLPKTYQTQKKLPKNYQKMATLKPMLRIRNRKSFYPVYIRISNNSTTDYLKTSIVVSASAANMKGEITNTNALSSCYVLIRGYYDRLSAFDCEAWTASEIKLFLNEKTDGSVSFTEFARQYIFKMKQQDRWKPASNYRTAINSLLNYLGVKELSFADITSKKILGWIDFLSHTKRAKNLYPVCISKLFTEGCKEYNDYDRGILRIKNQPFRVISIPKPETPDKRTTDADTIRTILATKPETPREELAHDIIMLVLCLAGINTADLYKMDAGCRQGDYICYNRVKTMAKRKDRSFFKIRLRDGIKPTRGRKKFRPIFMF